MEKAAFSIDNYMFDFVHIDLLNKKGNELSISFDTKGFYYEKNSKYDLIFKVNVFSEGNKKDAFISIRCVGTFVFENVSKIEEIPTFFYRNSIAILFPYVRAYISLVTTQANFKGVILPTLNLSGLEDDLRTNTLKR
jgi:preprotein translocase subunit SecB